MRILIIGMLVLGLALLAGCTNTSKPPQDAGGGGQIFSGISVPAASVLMSSAGGSLVVANGSDPVSGLTITVPAGSYADARMFTVASAPIYGDSFGAYFTAVSPLITISNDGGYANHLLQVKIPVKKAAGDFAMAFFYDGTAQTLEGLPLIAEDDTSVTVATRHFTYPGTASSARLVVTAIPEQTLRRLVPFVSRFWRGIDDWAFPNYGSSLWPAGHGPGQTLSALWYYHTQRLPGGPRLATLLPGESAALWEDDTAGYRFASLTQTAVDWEKLHLLLTSELPVLSGQRTWDAFAYALLLTAAPQLITLEAPGSKGQAMLINNAGSSYLGVVDPNFPGDTNRRIAYDGSTLAAYITGDTAQKVDVAFDRFRYPGVSALIPWTEIGELWPAVQAGTIGNNDFPDFTLQQVLADGSRIVLDTGTVIQADHITLAVRVGDRNDYLTPFSADGTRLATTAATLIVPLALGENRIGLCVSQGADPRDRWEGFRWISLRRE